MKALGSNINLAVNDHPCETTSLEFGTPAFLYVAAGTERIVAGRGFWLKVPRADVSDQVDLTEALTICITADTQQLRIEDVKCRVLSDGTAFFHTTHGRPYAWTERE